MPIFIDGQSNTSSSENNDIIVAQFSSSPVQDFLLGEGGNDVLIGDIERVYVDNTAGNSSRATAINLDTSGAVWTTFANPLVGDDSIPYTTVISDGTGTVDYYSVNVAVGETLTADIDFAQGNIGSAGFDPLLRFFEGATQLDENDDNFSSLGGIGSISGRDSYLSYTNTTNADQTVVIEVSRFEGLSIPADSAYMLHASLTNHASTNVSVHGNDSILGGDGNDFIVGNLGDDTLQGNDDNDTIYAGGGNDLITGGLGDDSLFGGDGDDRALLGDGTDRFEGGAGDDTVTGGDGASVMDLGAGDDLAILGTNASDTVFGGTGADLIGVINGVSISAGDRIVGGDDDSEDVLNVQINATGSFEFSQMFIDGIETLQVSETGAFGDLIFTPSQLEAFETLNATYTTNLDDRSGLQIKTIMGDVAQIDLSSLQITGNYNATKDAFFIEAGDGGVAITGTSVRDGISGGAGNDTIDGNGGPDFIRAGGGNDAILISSTSLAAVYDGDEGSDLLSALNAPSTGTVAYTSMDVNFVQGTLSSFLRPSDGVATLEAIERYQDNDGSNRIYTNDQLSRVNGAGGDDLIVSNSINMIADAGAGNDTVEVIERTESQFASSVRMFDGGEGTDFLNLYNGQLDRSVNLGSGASNYVFEQFIGFENIYTGAGNDTIVGSSADNSIVAWAGDDLISGGSGNDNLSGMTGNDTLTGGAGDDAIYGGEGIDVAIFNANLADTTVIESNGESVRIASSEGEDLLSGIESFQFADQLITFENLLAGAEFAPVFLEDNASPEVLFETNNASPIIGEVRTIFSDYGSFLNEHRFTVDALRLIGETRNIGATEAEIRGYLTPGQTVSSSDGVIAYFDFTAPAATFDYLTAADTLTLEYDITAIDADGGTGSTTARVEIRGANDAPVASAAAVLSVTENTPAFTFDLTSTITDVDLGDQALLAARNVTGLTAGVTLDAANVLRIDAQDAAFASLRTGETRTITIDYEVIDPTGAFVAQSQEIEVTGTDPFNVVTGTDSSENVAGTAATDGINAMAGNDWITPGTGNDTVDGGAGRDMLSFSDLGETPGQSPIEYRLDLDMSTGRATTSGDDVYTFSNVERVTGTIYADRIKGDAGDNDMRGLGNYDWFIASEGNDFYDGGTGQDMVSYLEAGVGVTVSLSDSSLNTGLAAGDTYTSIERVTGSSFSDVFFGDGAENFFRGMGGFDVFYGSDGGRERYDGGSGSDTVTYASSTAGIRADLGRGFGSAGDARLDLYTSIENLGGTAFDDVLTGTDDRNNLRALGGDDMIFGGGGIDRIAGGRGDDTIDGGAGSDYILFNGDSSDFDITRDAGTRNAVVSWTGSGGGDGTDTLTNIEYLVFDDRTIDIWSL